MQRLSVHPRSPAGPLRPRTSPAELVLLPPGLDRGLLPTPAQQQRLSAEVAQPAARAASNVLDELGGRRPTRWAGTGGLGSGPAPPQRRRPWSWPARARCRGGGALPLGGCGGLVACCWWHSWPAAAADRRRLAPNTTETPPAAVIQPFCEQQCAARPPEEPECANRRSPRELPPHPPSGGAKDAYARGPPGAPGGTGDQLGGRGAWYVPWTASGAT